MSFKLQEKEVLGENVTTTEDQIVLLLSSQRVVSFLLPLITLTHSQL